MGSEQAPVENRNGEEPGVVLAIEDQRTSGGVEVGYDRRTETASGGTGTKTNSVEHSCAWLDRKLVACANQPPTNINLLVEQEEVGIEIPYAIKGVDS
jgi:hypothetical protein